jgi:hypothetical protein
MVIANIHIPCMQISRFPITLHVTGRRSLSHWSITAHY